MKYFKLPDDYTPYIDKYFLRAKYILQCDNLNPTVTYQVFIRQGNCKVYGINEAIAILSKYSDIEKTGHIYSLKEGDYFEDGECLMIIEAPIQSIIDLETIYLGVISAETTRKNNDEDVNLKDVRENMRKIVDLIKPRPVSYFGARHWSWDLDYEISRACFAGGAANCSTDEGARTVHQKGIGTIPHSLEAIYHWKYGLEMAVFIATDRFDNYINEKIPRIALVDYANREIMDSLVVSEIDRLYGIRIDTCGENYMQGTLNNFYFDPYWNKYWFGKGVNISGVYILRKILPENIKIILSSGFGNEEKVKEFVEAEKILKMKLFDGLGVGGVFHSRMATSDIMEVEGQEIHKVGRNPKKSDRLIKIF